MNIKKTAMIVGVVLTCAAVVLGGGLFAQSAAREAAYDGKYYLFDSDAPEKCTVRLPARSSVAELREPSFFGLFEWDEERQLTYEGSWQSGRSRQHTYSDDRGGSYFFDAKTGSLYSISFYYEESPEAPPADITKEEILHLAQAYMERYQPQYEQYDLVSWHEREEVDTSYDPYAYVMHYDMVLGNGWYFNTSTTVMFDSYGRLHSFVFSPDNPYASIPEEERDALQKALPDEAEVERLLTEGAKAQAKAFPFEYIGEPSRTVMKTDEGYKFIVSVDIRVKAQDAYRHTVTVEQMLTM
ncbi:MAG: hypothetical protein IJD01_00475 [Clostridia bacterium]|nr:hypothetical protein [Clostridia bacterium]